MNLSGADRTRQLITVGVGTLLLLVMGGVLIAGFRLATQMNSNVTALQTASVLQTYPNTIAAQINSLRDRLEARAYAGQALADVRATVDQFDKEMKQLGDFSGSPQVVQALQLWQQYGPVVDPVVDFTGQPYADSDEAGSSLSNEGKTHYADVKRAQLFAQENAKRLQGIARQRCHSTADRRFDGRQSPARVAVHRCARSPRAGRRRGLVATHPRPQRTRGP